MSRLLCIAPSCNYIAIQLLGKIDNSDSVWTKTCISKFCATLVDPRDSGPRFRFNGSQRKRLGPVTRLEMPRAKPYISVKLPRHVKICLATLELIFETLIQEKNVQRRQPKEEFPGTCFIVQIQFSCPEKIMNIHGASP